MDNKHDWLLCSTWCWCVCLLLSGCGDGEQQAEAVVPRVKCFTVSEQAVGQVRRLSGSVVAGDSSPLSFAVGGTVERVPVELGEQVTRGQVLATLDTQPLSLAAERARGQLDAARESVNDASERLEEERELLAAGAAFQRDVDAAETNLATAQANLRTAQADLDRAELDLKRTTLRAPSDGVIASREVEPSQEVSPGQTLFVLESEADFIVEVNVPETMIRDLDHGQTVQVTFPTLDAEPISGTITTIGSQAQSGNAFPVEVELEPGELDLRSGMSANVAFRFDQYLEQQTAYMIPITCIAVEVDLHAGRQPDPDDRKATVFLLDEETGKIELRRVTIGGLRGNMLEVFEGLKPGDKVVSAGVAFVRDGMEARAWTPDQGLSDG